MTATGIFMFGDFNSVISNHMDLTVLSAVFETSDTYYPLLSMFFCLWYRTSTGDITSLRLITAVKTPYLPDGRFDLEAYDSLINMQIEAYY